MTKKVRDAMTVEPGAVEPGLSLAEAAQLMMSEDVGSLPVVDDGRLVAMLTDGNGRSLPPPRERQEFAASAGEGQPDVPRRRVTHRDPPRNRAQVGSWRGVDPNASWPGRR
jgi:hypothetical protein